MFNIDCDDRVKEFWVEVCSEVITSRLIKLTVSELIIYLCVILYYSVFCTT